MLDARCCERTVRGVSPITLLFRQACFQPHLQAEAAVRARHRRHILTLQFQTNPQKIHSTMRFFPDLVSALRAPVGFF